MRGMGSGSELMEATEKERDAQVEDSDNSIFRRCQDRRTIRTPR